MDTRSVDEFFHFLYDPQVYGLSDSFFKTISGTPSVVANKIRLTSATVATASEFCLGEYEFNFTVPVAPVLGQSKKWGLFSNAVGNNNAIYFNISGAVFTVTTYTSDGVTPQTTTIAWDATWTAVPAVYKIKWFKEKVEFWINGLKYASHTTSLPNEMATLPVEMVNGNADNLDLGYLRFTNVRIEVSPDEVGDVSIGSITVHSDNTVVEDSAHVSGDKGTMALAVRKDAIGTLSTTDGDYTPLQIDSMGRLRVYAETPLEESWVDTTSIAGGTHYYPGVDQYTAMAGYQDLSLTGYINDADSITTLTVEGTNDEDPAAANWSQLYGWDTHNNTAANAITATLGAVTFSLDFDNLNYRYVRAVLFTSDNTNTVIIKARRK